jgi:arsenic resistance protein ArsH
MFLPRTIILRTSIPKQIANLTHSSPFSVSLSRSLTMATTSTNGDLNNTAAERARSDILVDPAYRHASLALPAHQDDPAVRQAYRPFLLEAQHAESDWIARLELSTVLKMVDEEVVKKGAERIKVLVLYGSMRER